MTTSSSSAADKNPKLKIWKKYLIIFVIIIFIVAFLSFNQQETDTFIMKTLELKGSVEDGDVLFKMNCVGCHGITARGLVGPDLHSITI